MEEAYNRIIELEEENKNLKEELEQYKKMFEDKLKEVYIKNTADLLDKKFPKIN
jgi:flagellar basal body-associated protein FliL